MPPSLSTRHRRKAITKLSKLSPIQKRDLASLWTGSCVLSIGTTCKWMQWSWNDRHSGFASTTVLQGRETDSQQRSWQVDAKAS